MYANGFFEQQQRRSPVSLALVVALHAAGFGALILAGGTQFLQQPPLRTTIVDVTIPPDPEPIPPREVEPQRPTQWPVFIDTVPPLGPVNDNRPTTGSSDPGPSVVGDPGPRVVESPPTRPPDPPPLVRREPQLDPRYARDLQPPYPAQELRAERDGLVRIRLTIAPNGRVAAVQRLSATSDAFWRVTEQQALRRWRFRPATLDGRPVQGVKEMTVNFRIQDAA
jgi:protein TonB